MKVSWFTQRGLFYLPKSIWGWIIFLITIIWLIYEFISIDSRSHSVSDTLRNFIFIFILTGIAYTLIGFITKVKSGK